MEFAMLYDVEKCIACRGCSVACKQWKNLPAEDTTFKGTLESNGLSDKTYTYIKMKEFVENNKVKWEFLKYQCMHCGKPDCMRICPVDAVSKTSYGIVIVDESKCVGCNQCGGNDGCKYKVPHVSSSDRKAKKCNMCIDRVEKYVESGYNRKYMPACAKTCTADAILFGPREEMVKIANERLEVLKQKYKDACTYNVETNDWKGGGAMMYVLPYRPAFYGLR